jgi:Flp pilus assembly protein TadD
VRRNSIVVLLILLWLPAGVFAVDKSLVIVFPMDGLSSSGALQWLSEGVAVSVSGQLDGREVKAMDRSERLKLVENLDLPPGARLSRGSMIRVAQRAGADLLVMGAYSGTEQNLRIAVRVLHLKTLKLGGEMVANGSLASLPQMENDLAWLILSNNGLEKSLSREKVQERARKIPNQAYASYIQSLYEPNESEQLKLLLKAVQTYRDFPEAQFRLGRLYFRKGDCGSAIPHLLLGRSESSTLPESDFMRGTCYLQGDQPLQAVQAFWRLQQVSPPFEALNNIGVAYLRKGDLSLALNSFIDARNLSRTDAVVSLNLAIVRHMQGNDAAARAVLEESAKVHPQNGMLQFMLGVVLTALGENEKGSAATLKARNLAINVEKLHGEDPPKWSRVFSSFDSSTK